MSDRVLIDGETARQMAWAAVFHAVRYAAKHLHNTAWPDYEATCAVADAHTENFIESVESHKAVVNRHLAELEALGVPRDALPKPVPPQQKGGIEHE